MSGIKDNMNGIKDNVSGTTDNMNGIKDHVFIHIPFNSFSEYRSRIAGYRINPEILVTAEDLDGAPNEDIEKIGRFLEEHKLSCTIHGPFLDLNPGSSDSKIRRISQDRYRQLLSLVAPLAPKVVVFHAAFDHLFYEERTGAWLYRSIETWLSVAEAAENARTSIALENVLERTPQIIQELLLKINSPSIGMCFDIGHAHIFSQVPSSDWITVLGPRIFELHLHDNHGQKDEHLALGEGTIGVEGLLKMVQEKELSPALTIEALNEEHALLSVQRLCTFLSKKERE
ncbi:MAG: sugar phosphate isomerase/epimerase family protein [bacterium]